MPGATEMVSPDFAASTAAWMVVYGAWSAGLLSTTSVVLICDRGRPMKIGFEAVTVSVPGSYTIV